MLAHLAEFPDPDDTIGFRLSPPTPSPNFSPAVYLSLSDGLDGYTDDPKVLDLLAEMARKGADALRNAQGLPQCDGPCGLHVERTWPTPVTHSVPGDHAGLGEVEVMDLCAVCRNGHPDDELPDDYGVGKDEYRNARDAA